ncbi:MAG: class I SAM-dependent methyltransferase [bacterium]
MNILFKDNSEQKMFVSDELKNVYPKFKKAGCYYIEYLKEYVNCQTIVLDAGCGGGGVVEIVKPIAKEIVGIDNNHSALYENKIVNRKILADLENIPLSDNSIDVITCDFVVEHLRKPELVFNEFNRVLKKGGVLIFLTPNVLNPIMMLSKITPLRLHNFLIKNILKKQKQAHNAFYRANTYTKLLSLAHSNNFEIKELIRVGNPEYIAFCKILARPAIHIEQIIDNKFLDWLKMYLVGNFIKI